MSTEINKGKEKAEQTQFLNKRDYDRINLQDPIRLITSEYTFEEYMGNISKTGCMILALKEKEIGQQLKVSINDPEKGYQDFDCIVTRIKEKDQQQLEIEEKEIKDLLLVDDDIDVLSTLASNLEADFNIEVAESAEAAKKYLTKFHFRAVLTDARMPGEDGADLLSYVMKNQPQCRRLMLTGQADNELMQRAINDGAIEKVLYKPANLKELTKVLESSTHKNSPLTKLSNTSQRHYNCYTCHYNAFRVDLVDGAVAGTNVWYLGQFPLFWFTWLITNIVV